DKERVMREICRVLRPGGRLVIADLVWLSRPPSWVRSAPEAWACCIGGALEATEYLGLLERAGFGSIKLRTSDCAAGLASTLVTARKPGAPGLGFQVREAQPEDIDLVLRILDAARLPTAGVAEHLPSFLLACTPDGNVVGVVGLERYHSSALLRSLVVLPSWRNQGLGRRLVASQLARLTPETPVYLLTAGAEAYFRSLGFEVIPRDQVCPEVKASAEFQGACPASAVAMRSIAHRNPGK
ncbi:MAG: arsenic resistance N-acetyltransferase ArsN2, partial [Bacillota bacterium]